MAYKFILTLIFAIFLINFVSGEKYAFATFHYDDLSISKVNVRVWARSLKNTRTENDIIVITHEGVSESTKKRFEDDGLIVIIDSEMIRPYEAKAYNFINKQRLFSLADYDRVAFMESTTLVLNGVDSLFLCKGLCLTMTQPFLYVSDLMIVDPKSKEMKKIYARTVTEGEPRMVDSTYNNFNPSLYELVDRAPHFDPAGGEATKEVSVHRLPAGYSLNHLFYYEKLDWNLYRCDATTNLTIPAFTLSYGYPNTIFGLDQQPAYWWSSYFFSMHSLWDSTRDSLQGDTMMGGFMTMVLTASFLTLVIINLFEYIVGNNYKNIAHKWRLVLQNLGLYNVNSAGKNQDLLHFVSLGSLAFCAWVIAWSFIPGPITVFTGRMSFIYGLHIVALITAMLINVDAACNMGSTGISIRVVPTMYKSRPSNSSAGGNIPLFQYIMISFVLHFICLLCLPSLEYASMGSRVLSLLVGLFVCFIAEVAILHRFTTMSYNLFKKPPVDGGLPTYASNV